VAYRASESAQIASTVGPASSVVGGLMGLEMLHLLAGRTPATRDFAFIVNMQTLDVRRAAVARDPACATCKHLR
jgi:bacteriocin biosynthesis cyclodehydratase domain-containing protein